MKNIHGDFSSVCKIYNSVRPQMPDEVINFILSEIENKNKMLDVGCGTGLITKQFSKYVKEITGTDNGEEMLETANRENKTNNIHYLFSRTEDLIFPDDTFDFITAFSSFHWFTNDIALSKIHTTLKPNGKYFAINRNMKGVFNELQRESNLIFKKYISENIESKKSKCEPGILLANFGFKNVSNRVFSYTQNETREGLFNFLKTTSIYNIISEDLKEQAEKEVCEYLSIKIDENFQKEFEIAVVQGQK